MKCLVIGLGSMGKRRIRCLKALEYNDIIGFDLRKERRAEAIQNYSIETVSDYRLIDFTIISLIIISTPPDKHFIYCKDAILNKIPCFVEASVLLQDVSKTFKLVESIPSFVAPSCTLRFHPAIQIIKKIVQGEEYGSVTNFSYHCGQYLPDWHPWENINEYYVSKRETGGAREIVPFELTWLTDIFGLPQDVKGYFSETMKLDAKIENTYSFSLKYNGFLGSMIVDVVSRFATRSLIVNFERAQLRWNWEDNMIRLYDPANNNWETVPLSHGDAEKGYNSNIIEEMYVHETEAFINGIREPALYPNSLESDKKILTVLKQIEDSDGGFERGFQ